MMVSPVKHLRKWLFALAVAAQKRLQAVVDGLATTEGQKPAADGPESAAGKARSAHPGGPPDHWVKLVKRHAPELLESGAFTTAGTRAAAPLAGTGTGIDEPAGRHPGDRRSSPGDTGAGEAPDAENRIDPPEPVRVPPGSGDQGDGQQDSLTAGQSHVDDSSGSPTVATAQFRLPEDNAAVHTRPSPQTGTVELHQRCAPDPVKTSRGQAGYAPHQERRHDAGWPTTADRSREFTPDRRVAVGLTPLRAAPRAVQRRFPRQSEEPPVAAKASTAPEQPVRRTRTILQKATGRPRPVRSNAGQAIDKPQYPQTVFAPHPKPDAALKAPEPNPGAGGAAPPDEPAAHDRDPIRATVPTAARTRPRRPPTGEAAERKMPAARLEWPNLPGETVPEYDRDAQPAARWPRLSAKPPAGEISLPNPLESQPSGVDAHKIEHLRRLDDEHKGNPWNASPF